MKNYDAEEEIIRRGRLMLEKLLLNMLGCERVIVINDDNSLTVSGTEEEIRTEKPQWLHLLVSKIHYNPEAEMIQINVMSEGN